MSDKVLPSVPVDSLVPAISVTFVLTLVGSLVCLLAVLFIVVQITYQRTTRAKVGGVMVMLGTMVVFMSVAVHITPDPFNGVPEELKPYVTQKQMDKFFDTEGTVELRGPYLLVLVNDDVLVVEDPR